MRRGYVHLWRKFLSHSLWLEKRKFSRAEAWIDMILQTNGTDKSILFDGISMIVRRGQLLTSERKLAEHWGWSKTKTRVFLNGLQKVDRMIERESDHKKTLITVLNYELYNPLPEQKKTSDIEEEKTTERPQKDHRLAPTKKEKERKEGINKKYPKLKYSDSHIKIAKFLEQKIKERLPRYQLKGKNYLEQWANEARLMEEKGEATIKEMERLIIWIYSKSDFWSKNILSFGNFREKFGRLWAEMEESNPQASQIGKNPPISDLSLCDSDWQKIAHYLYESGKLERDVSKFFVKQKQIFPKIANEWDRSDKKPETFIQLINSQGAT